MKKLKIDHLKNKKVLIVGLGRTGFALIPFFNNLQCEVRVTDIKPIFDLNKAVKRLKKFSPKPQNTFGEHRDQDFLEADIIVHSVAVDPKLPQLCLAREHKKLVYSEFELAYALCNKPIIAVVGTHGRTTVAHIIAFGLRHAGKKVYVGGSSDAPFINFYMQNDVESFDYVIVEVSAEQLQTVPYFHPEYTVFHTLETDSLISSFSNHSAYLEAQTHFLANLTRDNFLVINFDRLATNTFLRSSEAVKYWYSRRSFVKIGVIGEIDGTHFHDKRIHSNVHCHSEFIVGKMRILGAHNRENLLAAITMLKVLNVEDEAISHCITKFPGIPHRLEFVTERNGVRFYNDSKCESMLDLRKTLRSIKSQVILIAGGKDTEQDLAPYTDDVESKVRIMVLVGEVKENFNRGLGDYAETYLVGSFDESILLAYQKARTGDIVLLSPGNSSTDVFRDFEERGNYYKKLVFQL